jgi:DNA-binding response OmpR family regulator
MVKILIVDDNFELTQFLTALLRKQNFEVIIASTVGEARSAIELFEPDLIFLDVLLDGTNGRDMCKEIKEISPRIFIILMSAYPKLLQNYKECNAADFLEKPFDFQVMLDKVNNLFNKKEL